MACPHCKRSLRHENLSSGMQVCPYCGGMFEAVRFAPAGARVVVPEVGGAGPEGATPCARHARNAAVATCERCGSFICELCRIEADGKVLCPPCFDRLSAEGALRSAVSSFRDYGLVAQSWAALGLLVGGALGPLAVVYGLKGLRQKKEMGESQGIAGIYFYAILGVLESVAFVLLVVLLLMAFFGVLD